MMQASVILKKGREWALLQRHHWIFSGAIASYPEGYIDGELVPISSAEGKQLGYGYFNRKTSLAGRVVVFGEKELWPALEANLDAAIQLRTSLLHSTETTAFRLINGEGDGFPGLIVDKYGPYLVVQTGSLGMRRLLPWLIDQLKSRLSLAGIYDKSSSGSLKEEGIEPCEGVIWGSVPERVEILEGGIRYFVEIAKGQKTGFFLDQREMRAWVQEMAKGKKVLNAFSYSGGFTLAALQGGATQVDSVDISASAMQLCRDHVALNGFDPAQQGFYEEDLFHFLDRSESAYDLLILDPPAFAKKKRDIPAATKGYKRIFGQALRKMPSHALLLASSCSYYITPAHFEEILQMAAREAGRPARILGRHRLALDHPENLFHPESRYLKSLLITIS